MSGEELYPADPRSLDDEVLPPDEDETFDEGQSLAAELRYWTGLRDATTSPVWDVLDRELEVLESIAMQRLLSSKDPQELYGEQARVTLIQHLRRLPVIANEKATASQELVSTHDEERRQPTQEGTDGT